MKEIKTYTYPQGQQLGDGEVVQVQVQVSSRLIFKDAYFHELQDGDVYIIPEQVELESESDGEILDYVIRHNIHWQHTQSWRGEPWMAYYFFKENKMIKNIDYEVTNGDNTSVDLARSRGVFREAISELIQNDEL